MGLHPSTLASLAVAVASVALSHCSSSSSAAASGGTCYPDSDGVNDQPATVDVVVDDTGFYSGSADSGPVAADAGMKKVITTQNASTITLTLSNKGTTEHGFEVECASVTSAYPDLPAGCSSMACFPSGSTIAPIAPGTSKTVTFVTPVPDNILFPFKSSAPGDGSVPGLNGSGGSAWSLM
jgi:hypothetical protein